MPRRVFENRPIRFAQVERRSVWLAAALLLLFWQGMATQAQEPPLELERTIALPDVKGRIDHLTLDASGARLWLAALENNSIEIVDLDTMKRPRSLTGPKEPQGICVIPDLKRIVVASGGMVWCGLTITR